MEAIPELNIPGMSPTAAKNFHAARFASYGLQIPDGTPRELYSYHARDFQDEFREELFKKRVYQYFLGKCFTACVPCMIWLLNGWPDWFGQFCMDWVRDFLATLGKGEFGHLKFEVTRDIKVTIAFLWDFIMIHSWTPMPYIWLKPFTPTVIRSSKSEDPMTSESNTQKLDSLWCKIQIRSMASRLEIMHWRDIPVSPPKDTERRMKQRVRKARYGIPLDGYDEPLDYVPPPPPGPIWGEREELYAVKDMREAARKISAKEFVHLDVTALLKKTDVRSLVDRYFFMLDKGEFRFLEKGRGGGVAGFV